MRTAIRHSQLRSSGGGSASHNGMSRVNTFKGLTAIKRDVKKLSRRSGVKMEVHTVSCELPSYREGQFQIERNGWSRALVRLFDAYAPKRDNSWREYGVEFENDTFWVHPYNEFPECACAYRKQEKRWLARNPHGHSCFQPYIAALVAKVEKAHPVPEFEFIRAVGDYDIAEIIHMFHGGPEPSAEMKAAKRAEDAEYEKRRGEWSKAHDKQQAAITALVLAEAAKHHVGGGGNVKLGADNAHWMWTYLCTCGHDKAYHNWQMTNEHFRPCELWWSNQPQFLHKPTGYGVHWYKYPCRDAYGTQPIDIKRFQAIIRECIATLERKPAEGR